MRSSPRELDPDPELWDWHGPRGSGLEVLAEYERWATSQLEEAGLPTDAGDAEHALNLRRRELSRPLGEPVPVGGGLTFYTPVSRAEQKRRRADKESVTRLWYAVACLGDAAAARSAAEAGDLDAAILHTVRAVRWGMFGAWYQRMKWATDQGVNKRWALNKMAGKFEPKANNEPGPTEYRAAALELVAEQPELRKNKSAVAERLAHRFGRKPATIRRALNKFSL